MFILCLKADITNYLVIITRITTLDILIHISIISIVDTLVLRNNCGRQLSVGYKNNCSQQGRPRLHCCQHHAVGSTKEVQPWGLGRESVLATGGDVGLVRLHA